MAKRADEGAARATLAQVAAAAGVSPKTASLALLRGLGARSTVDRVARVAREMGFVSRKKRHGSRILLVVTPLDSNPTYYGELLDQLMRLGASESVSVVHVPFAINRPMAPEYEEVRTVLRGKLVAAVLVGAIAAKHWQLMLAREAIPLISVGMTSATANQSDIPRVCIGNDGMVAALRHVIAAGRTSIAYIRGPAGSSSNTVRQKLIAEMLGEYGKELHPHMIRDHTRDDQFEAGFDAGIDLLRAAHKPDAIFAYNDVMALGALNAIAKECGSGERPWVIGHDDLPFARFAIPPLATIRIDRAGLARVIFEAAVHDHADGNSQSMVQTHFELRESARDPGAITAKR